MIPVLLLDKVAAAVKAHCAAKGHVRGPHWNPLTPNDPVAALAMARRLVASGEFDDVLAIAPEGHVYGFFFERLGVPVLSAFVDYPPTRLSWEAPPPDLRGRRVLVLEDDVVSGTTLRLVVDELARLGPRSIALYLGREEEAQSLENVPPGIERVFLSEQHLDPADRGRHEAEFLAFCAEHRLEPVAGA